MTKKRNIPWSTICIVAGVLLFAVVALKMSGPEPVPLENFEDIATCIGERSTLYVQLGCSHCKDQEELFGEYYDKLKTVDCAFQQSKCFDIEGTPTWVIGSRKYVGVHSIPELQELTGCE